MLRRSMTLFRSPPIPGGGIGEIGENSMPAGVEQPQAIRGFGISGRRRRGPFLERFGVVLAFVGVGAALHSRSGRAQPRIEPSNPLSPRLPPA